MRREKWTLLLLSEDGDDLLQRTFQIRTLRYAVGAWGLVCVGLLAATGLFGFLVGSVATSDLEAFRSLYLRAEEGVLAANGPLQAEELSSVLSDAVRDLGEGGEV